MAVNLLCENEMDFSKIFLIAFIQNSSGTISLLFRTHSSEIPQIKFACSDKLEQFAVYWKNK